MSPAIKRPIALAMLAVACGCASQKPDYYVAAKTAPRISIDHESPAVRLKESLNPPVIVPAERMAEVGGSELLAQTRAAFTAWREARIAAAGGQGVSGNINMSMSGEDAAQLGLGCLIYGPIFCALLPVTLPMAFAMGSVHDGGKRAIRRAKAARREAKLVIPENEATRLLGVMEARATTASLAARTAAYALPADSGDVDSRIWLVVGLESINVDTLPDQRVAMRIAAHAQAITASGTVFPPTKHVYEWKRWAPGGWTAEDSALLEQALEPALEALAQGIAIAYTPSFNLEEQEEELADAQRTLRKLFPAGAPS